MDDEIKEIMESLEEKSDATRRNLDQMGAAGFKELLLGDSDGGNDRSLIYVAGIIVWILYQITPDGPEGALITLGCSVVIFTSVGLAIYLSPEGLSTWQWIKYIVAFRRGDEQRSAVNGDQGRLQSDSLSTNGRRKALEDLTRIDGFSENADGVWRFDGALVGGVGIKAAELSLAQDDDWETVADELGDAINALNITGEIRSSSTLVDSDAQQQRANDRLSDDDVVDNDPLKRNVLMYKNQLKKQLESKNASIRGFQFLTEVSMEEVTMKDRRIVRELAKLPLVGNTIGNWGSDLSIHETRYRQERVLMERQNSIEVEMSSLTGCDADVLSLDDLKKVFAESWTGRPMDESRDSAEQIPVVSMKREYTEAEGDVVAPEKMADSEIDEALAEMLGVSVADDDTQDTVEDTEPDLDPDPERATPSEEGDEVEATETEADDDGDDDTGLTIPNDMLAEEAGEEKETEETEVGDEEPEQPLTAISGVGETTADWLQEAGFETASDVRAATEEEIADAYGFGLSRAAEIKENAENVGAEAADQSTSGEMAVSDDD